MRLSSSDNISINYSIKLYTNWYSVLILSTEHMYVVKKWLYNPMFLNIGMLYITELVHWNFSHHI